MKSSALKAIALSAFFSTPALAAGPYDGVYQYGLSPAFFSVHQNGGTLLVVSLGQLAVRDSDIEVSIGSHTVRPNVIGNWDYSLGAITGNKARVSGTSFYGSCVSTTDLSIDGGVVTATLVSITNAPLGTSQGVNCQQVQRELQSLGATTITLRKIF